jgi:hypothetical protein
MLTGYWIRDGHIFGTDGSYTRCWIEDGHIYSIDDGYLGFIKDDHI